MLSAGRSTGRIIAIVGGGAYVPALCEALARAPIPGRLHIRLSARRGDRLAIIAAHAGARVTALRPDDRWTVEAARDRREAIDGADDVVLLVRVGGTAARAHDERFPRELGLVGDEGLGPGGIANAYRTIPVLAELAGVVRRGAPHARVWNLVAPLGATTRVLLDEGVDAVGVCELPAVTLERLLAAASARPDDVRPRVRPRVRPDDVRFEYAGLNHLGWFWDVRAGDVDVLARAAEAGLVDAPTLDRFGAAPLKYFYEVFAPAAASRLGLVRDPERAATLATVSDRLLERYRGNGDGEPGPLRPTPWFDRALAPMIAACAGGPPFAGFANVRNAGGAIAPSLPPGAVVETATSIAGGVLVPRPWGTPPPAVERFLQQAARAEALAFAAARAQSPALVRRAIEALPLEVPRAALDGLVARAIAPIVET